MSECYMCLGTGIGQGDPNTSRCPLCKGSGELPSEDDFGDRADYEYDKRRDEKQ